MHKTHTGAAPGSKFVDCFSLIFHLIFSISKFCSPKTLMKCSALLLTAAILRSQRKLILDLIVFMLAHNTCREREDGIGTLQQPLYTTFNIFFQITFQRIESVNNIFLWDFTLAVGIMQYCTSLKLQVQQMLTTLFYDLCWGYTMKIIRTDQNGWDRVKRGIKFSDFINAFLFSPR